MHFLNTLAVLGASSFALAHPSFLSKRQDATGYVNPTSAGGSFLTQIPNSNLGEPINMIISSDSDAGVRTPEGFLEFMSSVYFR